MSRITGLVAGALVATLAACTSGDQRPQASPAARTAGPSAPSQSAPSQSAPSQSAPSPAATASPSVDPSEVSPPGVAFDASAAMATVRGLAALGPREATSGAYREAADVVAARFADLGYEVSLERFRVPAGESWGIPVDAGRPSNVVARLPGTRAGASYVIVGAHLDTVPQAPGAEDNASGVAVLLELARMTSEARTRRPVTFIAFGAEEPRGPADDQHHFGSLFHAGRLGDAPLRAMVALDRVGTSGSVPVCTGGLSPLRVRRQLLAAAERVGVPARPCENRTSDHWPFEKAGVTVARIGGNDYAAYHSPRDLPRVVSRRQLDRVGRVVWEWLRSS